MKHGGLEPAFKGPHPSSSVVVVVMPKKKERSKNLFFLTNSCEEPKTMLL